MIKNLALSFILILCGEVAFAAKSIPPSPINYVYDEAALLTSSTGTLSTILSQEDRQFGNQILVAVFKSLDQEDLVDYTNRVFTTWQPGEKGKNNGVLLAIYLKEKKIRIEAGYGLEPLLTDAKSKRIIIDYIGPAFGAQKYAEGIIGAVQEIQKVIHSEKTDEKPPVRQTRQKPSKLIFIFFPLLYFILRLIDRANPQTIGSNGIRRGGGWGGGGFGGGGDWGGGSGGDGGGFSGGGGSSGGGGASGDW